MKIAGHRDDFARLTALRRYPILDTPPEAAFDRITALAADLLEVPVALLSLVDSRRIWFKSVHGISGVSEIERIPGFCADTVQGEGCCLVEQASSDPRTRDHPLVSGEPRIDFYFGVPLRTPDGHALGALCGIDFKPRSVTPRQVAAIETLAAITMDEFELRRVAAEVTELNGALEDVCAELDRRANCDPLTGLLSRAAMLERGGRMVAQLRRQGQPAALLAFDIDRFRQLNDVHGPAAGDAALREVAARIGATCPPEALVGRIGAGEFLAVCPGLGPDEAHALGASIEAAVAASPVSGGPMGGELAVALVSGVVWLGPGERIAFAEALARADRLVARFE